MLLTQTAAGSEVEATVQDTVDTITGFNKFIQEKGPDLIAFGIRILMALLIFIICHKVINWIRKITQAYMERANSDTGARRWDADFIFEAFCCWGLYYRRQPWQ